MNSFAITPAQIRAGRALLEWSQEQLAQEAEVGLSTVRDVEGGKRAADTAAVASIRRALWNAGVVFVAGGSDRGAGVRLASHWPNIVRRPTTMQMFEGMPFTMEWQGKVITVFISREVLDDLDGHSRSMPVDVYLKTFERHRGKILDAITLAIGDPGNFDSYGRLLMRTKDIEAVDSAKWYKVVIDSGEDIRDIEAKSLINKFVSLFLASGLPSNVEVFHDLNSSNTRVYYFSPAAAIMAKDLLKSFSAVACGRPNMATLRKIKF
jgi:DNA-binding XRE family transcriptional regulator